MSSLTGEHEDGLWWTSENELITHGKNDSAAESGRRQFVDHGRVSTVVEEPRVPRRASSGLELVDEVEEVDYEEDADDEVDYEPRSDSERPAQHHPLATECARLECRNEPSVVDAHGGPKRRSSTCAHSNSTICNVNVPYTHTTGPARCHSSGSGVSGVSGPHRAHGRGGRESGPFDCNHQSHPGYSYCKKLSRPLLFAVLSVSRYSVYLTSYVSIAYIGGAYQPNTTIPTVARHRKRCRYACEATKPSI